MRTSILVVVLLAACMGNRSTRASRIVPINLQECYSNNGTLVPPLPLNLQVILDIIRKLEKRTHSFMPMRTLSTALIKRFKMDGVKQTRALGREGVLSYAASGSQRAKNRIVDELIPGDASLIPDGVLTHDELCSLHFAVSNTIWDQYDPSEEQFCEPGPSEKLSVNTSDRSFRPAGHECPKESGVIMTQFGTVALGSVIAAIAAALEPQLVKTKLLLTMPIDDEPASVSPAPRSNTDRSMWFESATISDTEIDNIWVATISGELAELVIYQGPIYEERMYLGSAGFWNNTMMPKVFYATHSTTNFDVTRAEIIGGVDGLIIAKNLGEWTKKLDSLRLSQVLDMYYSEKGIVFDRNVKACNRGDQFTAIAPKSLQEEQTYAAAQVLAYLNSIAAMSDAALQRMVMRSVAHFAYYTDQYLFPVAQCYGQLEPRPPRIELLLAFDGAWTSDYTANFLSVLIEDFDVSVYGSRIGIIHGETGEWLLNVTSSPSNAHQVINNLTRIEWPKTIKLPAIFETVLKYLDSSWEEKRNSNIIGNYGQAVVLLAPLVTLTDQEIKLALTILNKIKSKHPEVRFLYYTWQRKIELFQQFILSDEDKLVTSFEIKDISKFLSTVPVTLRPAGCNRNIPGVRLQFEDYVNPSETITYRLHPQWRVASKKVTISLHGVGYGTLKVCWWNQWTSKSEKTGMYCKNLPSFDEVKMSDYHTCDENNNCPNTYIQVSNVTTLTKCAEFGCKTPDQVRYIIRMENFECSSSSKIVVNIFLIVSSILFLNI